jgi:hypothetical protein
LHNLGEREGSLPSIGKSTQSPFKIYVNDNPIEKKLNIRKKRKLAKKYGGILLDDLKQNIGKLTRSQ